VNHLGRVRRTLGVAARDLVPGTRRAVPVERTGELTDEPGARLWACEQFDGLLWQLIAMARSEQECREFLSGR
jgi:hypothetical protein